MKTKKIFALLVIIVSIACLVWAVIAQEMSLCKAGILLGAILFIVGGSTLITKRSNSYSNEAESLEESLEELFVNFTEFVGVEALDGKTGGYFNIVKLPYDWFADGTVSVGDVLAEKRRKYYYLAREKPTRLYHNLETGQLSSYESRDPNFIFSETAPFGKWGGAILINSKTIYAFSGLPELLDEAFVCWVALRRNTMTTEHFGKICKVRENNPFLQKMLLAQQCVREIE